ncbi:16S rRNA (cytidine(1402)-2'-O)-methyltransferase [Thermaerobacter subterraneus]|uniref:Ribosomal RNA small subunit methyltransferase I n=1 Tax=Thermaerobacter subterraneus DSM 13965 TaxID=867903 RepID=K6Q0T2_9FIRM|nr:16S rRNA (cytidine(1402)-2'-O)-methyltransferase [Thermaerobacter subterraneus]EKP94738.1 putative S-adenosylmethionine-dependent methyltransferase, YraL family [Thermaerobacter subterraneus DSM 13965]
MSGGATGDWVRPGTLYVCASPIGNLGDVTLRLLEVLRQAGYILAEDTRRTRRLLSAHGLRGRVISCHEHNETQRAGQVLRWLAAGEVVALVTDAGTPGLADPGARLVGRVAAAGWPVVPVPGPSAALAALSVAGIPASRILIEGFLPRERERRRQRIAAWHRWDGVVVFFEAPHRLAAVLEDLQELLPDAYLVVAREMTKRHEEILRGRVARLAPVLQAAPPRGEYTLVLAPPGVAVPPDRPAPGEGAGTAGAGGGPGPDEEAGLHPRPALSWTDPGHLRENRSGNRPVRAVEGPEGWEGTGKAAGAGVASPSDGRPAGDDRPATGSVPEEPVPLAGPEEPWQQEAVPPDPGRLAVEVAQRVAAGLAPSAAAREVARRYGLSRSRVYRAYLDAAGSGRPPSDTT